ncbi:hypothetical protein CW751_05915 [Brumimicrobium salinarum]|uniref:DUF4149 domain-containing protein n=1 Tax=Brumimicrobium salinarum TaxID=2058658 RepID=A0A2I0R3G3_9FLAO|nr:hypothetical protein [Brumimicrobium salinarum]PKR81117.1 hypothetical protein CW751_05915 [Brumimicrobium salinarum]
MLELVIIATYLWVGFVCAISFMEAWLKFRAPGVSLEIGLGIGQLVFSALNKVEWTLAAVILINLLINTAVVSTYLNILLAVCLLILAAQTFVLLPKLKAMAALRIEGKVAKKSYIHFYYVIFELIKVVILAGIGYQLFNL